MKKILLIRFSSIGDIVLTSPIVRAIKQQTSFELHVLTKRQYSGIYQANPNVDKVHSFNKSIEECLFDLKKERFETVVDLQKNLRSYKLKRELKVKSYTFPKVNFEKWLFVNFKINKLPKIHIVDRYFKAVEPMGIVNDNQGLDYYVPAVDEIAPENFDSRLKVGYLGFVIGGQHSTKILPPEKAASIISRTHKTVVLFGGPDDKERADAIIRMLPDSEIINTCGELNINQSASLLRSSEVVLTNDTGMMHIAAAFDKPIISFWGNTVTDFGMYPYMPENNLNYFISEVTGLKCRPCSKIGFKKCPKKHFKCMLNQDEDAVIEMVKKFTT